jgi:hypothetical protein
VTFAGKARINAEKLLSIMMMMNLVLAAKFSFSSWSMVAENGGLSSTAGSCGQKKGTVGWGIQKAKRRQVM